MKFNDDFMEKKAQDALRKENEQIERKARLSELESQHQEKKRILLHPVKTMNERKEIKNLKEEISTYEKKKEERRSIFLLGGLFLACMILLFFSGLFHNSSEHNPPEEGTIVAMTNVESEAESSTQVSTSDTLIVINEESSKTATSTVDMSVNEDNASKESDTTTSIETTEAKEDNVEADDISIMRILSSNLRVSCKTDYAHLNNDSICLGNDEGITITIETDNKEVTADDLYFDYDTALLNVDCKDAIQQDGKTIITAYVTANEECSTELFITTNYEQETLDEDEVQGYSFYIRKLDSSEGRVVYVTPTGTKYHYRADCAGENAMKTTYHDAEMGEYEPCGTCVN